MRFSSLLWSPDEELNSCVILTFAEPKYSGKDDGGTTKAGEDAETNSEPSGFTLPCEPGAEGRRVGTDEG